MTLKLHIKDIALYSATLKLESVILIQYTFAKFSEYLYTVCYPSVLCAR